ncbi:MAG TPA: DsbA family protein [Methyloceanibacter sp.]|jgi:protein-disulfide isomerase|nr:DsbA family protein [Methyloceanibacter sp.]
MTPKTGLATALVAAIVAALVTAATLLVVWRAAPGVVEVPVVKVPRAALDEKTIIDVVRDYLTKNPEILVEMTTELDKRQQAAESAKQQKVIGENADTIFRSPLSYAAGNANGDVTVVEFFDYNCGYCRRALPDVVKLIDTDDKVRVVFKELPIFGEESEWAAKAALAAGKQGKYFEMHQKLYAAPGKSDKEKALRVAAEIGLDVPQLEKDMEDPSIKQALEETKELATKLGLQGTPLYLIGDRMIPGAPDDLYDQLVAKVAEIREKGCKVTC